MLRKDVRRRGEPFKHVLNNAIPCGLRGMKRREEAFEPLIYDMGEPLRSAVPDGQAAGGWAGPAGV
jgi:hypothetical protein